MADLDVGDSETHFSKFWASRCLREASVFVRPYLGRITDYDLKPQVCHPRARCGDDLGVGQVNDCGNKEETKEDRGKDALHKSFVGPVQEKGVHGMPIWQTGVTG